MLVDMAGHSHWPVRSRAWGCDGSPHVVLTIAAWRRPQLPDSASPAASNAVVDGSPKSERCDRCLAGLKAPVPTVVSLSSRGYISQMQSFCSIVQVAESICLTTGHVVVF